MPERTPILNKDIVSAVKNQEQVIESKSSRSLSKQNAAASTRREIISRALLVDIRLRMRRQKYKG